MVVFDATTLLYLFGLGRQSARRPRDRAARWQRQGTDRSREKIIVPTPALSELLVRAGEAGPEYLDILNKSAAFKIVDFDQRAAVEVAAATREAIAAGDKRGGADSSWAKVKFDRQIIAIAKVEGASTIYSDDGDIGRFSKTSGIAVVRVCDLPLPPRHAQQALPFDQSGEDS